MGAGALRGQGEGKAAVGLCGVFGHQVAVAQQLHARAGFGAAAQEHLVGRHGVVGAQAGQAQHVGGGGVQGVGAAEDGAFVARGIAHLELQAAAEREASQGDGFAGGVDVAFRVFSKIKLATSVTYVSYPASSPPYP